MFRLTATRLFFYTAAIILISLFFFGVVIMEDPPGFFGYIFGIITGCAWSALLVLYATYWEERQDEYQ